MKKIIYLMVFILLSFNVFGANCGGVTPCACGDTITSDYTMTSDLSCGAGALTISTDNLVLNCNGFALHGSGEDYGVSVTEDNIRVENCTIENFDGGIIVTSVEKNATIRFNTFENGSIDVLLDNTDYCDVSYNNFLGGARGIYSGGLGVRGNEIYYKNNFTKYTVKAVDIFKRDNITIMNNYFYDNEESVRFDSSTNNILKYNNIYNSTDFYGVVVSNSNYSTIDSNNISLTTRAIYIEGVATRNGGSHDFNITNNHLLNLYTNFDAWNLGIDIFEGSYKGRVTNNIIENYGNLGILVRYADNIVIEDNYCDELTTQEKIDLGVNTSWAEIGCIAFLELYATYTAESNETDYYNDKVPISNFRSRYVNVSGNTYSDNVQIKAWFQGTEELYHDLGDYDVLIQSPDLVNDTEIYFNDGFDRLTQVQQQNINYILQWGHFRASGGSQNRMDNNITISRKCCDFYK
jgi:parallel beta-helix repeat protein